MKKILIAEDDRFLVAAYKAKLEKEGFEVVFATDGQEALDALKNFTPDIILLDIKMPVMDGFTFLKKVKAIKEYKDIPVVVASNSGSAPDVEQGKALGAIDYIVKTNLSLKDVIKKITGIIEDKEAK